MISTVEIGMSPVPKLNSGKCPRYPSQMAGHLVEIFVGPVEVTAVNGPSPEREREREAAGY